MSLASVEPSPVREGETLRITVRISQPLPEDADSQTQVRGGVIVWDSWKGEYADQLIAFVFRAGADTRLLHYTVDDDGEPTTGRTIRVAANWVFDTYRVTEPSEFTGAGLGQRRR